MKVVALRDMKQQLSGYLARAQKGERLIITRHGEPAAPVIGFRKGIDLEDTMLPFKARKLNRPLTGAARTRSRR